jgi:RNA polymerase sigma-70 factor (ECF subfamily)
MTWHDAIPGLRAASTAPAAAEPAMEREAFAEFYERSARGLWAYLARVSGDPALADDLLQERFVRFLCAAQPQDGEVACRRYLFRIATNLMRDHWRAQRTSSIEDVPEEMLAAADVSGEADSRALMARGMKGLRPRDRQILWLAHAEGYTHQEIAEITGLGAASLRLMLFRARRKMAQTLRDGGAR